MESENNYVKKMNDNIRLTGFLEKKGKMKLMSQWKKYWFVLEKGLLLYYRSEVEYTNLSPCRGSLNMGLVTTVRPGSSTGPCIIHIITRTQSIQLRAKNRAAQEEWLQALLYSMAPPLIPKILKLPLTKQKLLGQTNSLENVSLGKSWKKTNLVHEWSLPRRLNYHKGLISSPHYGGSLDTAIWSKEFTPVRTPSSRIPIKGKVMDKFLEFSKETDSVRLVTSSHRDLRLNDIQLGPLDKNSKSDEIIRRKDGEKKCKVHDNSSCVPATKFLNGMVEKKNNIIIATFSDADGLQNFNKLKSDRKEESPFERIKNLLSRSPRDNLLKLRCQTEGYVTVKKRRQSFLQKVFGRKGTNLYDSEGTDYASDATSHSRHEVLLTNGEIEEDLDDTGKSHHENTSRSVDEKILKNTVTEVAKNMDLNKTPLQDSTTAELKINIQAEVQVLGRDEERANELTVEKEDSVKSANDPITPAPLLPPRRVSRPVSPWHDVPSNNAPIDSEKKQFFSHQGVVKFNDTIFFQNNDFQQTSNSQNYIDVMDDIRLNLIDQHTLNVEENLKLINKNKNDDLSLLLEQLTKITVAPLSESDRSTDCLHDIEKISHWSELSDPDYDIPRPHRPLSIIISHESEMYLKHLKGTNSSEKNSSFQSIEPDSLDEVDKKY